MMRTREDIWKPPPEGLRETVVSAKSISEGDFRAIVDGTHALLAKVDTRGRFLYVNGAIAKLVGRRPEEMLGRLYLRYVHPDDRGWVAHTFLRQVRTGQGVMGLEFRVIPVGDQVRWVRFVSTPILEKGRIAAHVATALDITDRIRLEEERQHLLEAEREQRVLAETLAEVTLALTSQTSHTALLDEILHQAQRVVAFDAGDISLLEGESLHTVRWLGYDRYGGEQIVSGAVRPLDALPYTKEATWQGSPIVVTDTHRDPVWVVLEETAWIRSALLIPLQVQNRTLGVMNLVSSHPGVFSQRDAERLQPFANAAAMALENAHLVEGLEATVATRTAEIRAEKEKTETILRSVSDAIVLIDLERRIQYVNAAFTTLTGYTEDEVLGRAADFLVEGTLPERPGASLDRTLALGEGWRGEATIRRKDGRTYLAALTMTPVRDAEGELVGYVSSHDDISQRKELEQARSQFMTNVTHQLSTPVTNMQVYTRLLSQGKPEKAGRYLQVLEEQADRLGHLVKDILEMTALDSGHAVQAWERVSVPSILKDVMTRYRDQAGEARLQLDLLPLPAGLPPVRGDRARLTQALDEVVENAIIFGRATAGDAPATEEVGQISITVDSVPDNGRQWLTIAVHDAGPGISPQDQDQLFDRFYRGRLAESGHIPGTGLGLSMAQELLRAHGGRLSVESDGVPGLGSTFTLWLPEAQD
jgi:PAS domain S-box-containing protein